MPKTQRPSETISIPLWLLLLIVAGLLLALFVLMQLIPVQRDNPPVVREPKWDSPQTRALAKRACFDCHSNETNWPWYAYIAPVSWTVTTNVQAGRARLNFSEWGIAQAGGEGGEGGGEMAQSVLNGRMPPAEYLAQHPEAQLTSAEKQQLAAGLALSLRQP